VKNRREWGEIFEKWLNKPHTADHISDEELEEGSDQSDEESEEE
jgi:hypothetical protein